MNSRLIIKGGCMLAACAMGVAVLVGTEPAAAAAADGNARPAATGARVKPTLEKGLTAEQVEKLVGKPTAIKPMDAPAGSKAEMWIYRRRAGTNSRQVEVSMKSVPMYVGPGMENPVSDVSVPEYQIENTIIYQITALLMVDGKLVLARQWKETERSYIR